MKKKRGSLRCRAERDEILRLISPAIRAELEVMDIDERRMPAPRHLAAPAVSAKHQAPNGGRNALRRSRSALRRSWCFCAHVRLSAHDYGVAYQARTK